MLELTEPREPWLRHVVGWRRLGELQHKLLGRVFDQQQRRIQQQLVVRQLLGRGHGLRCAPGDGLR
jgi:hypothetical protein